MPKEKKVKDSGLRRLISELEETKSAMHVYSLKEEILKYLKGVDE